MDELTNGVFDVLDERVQDTIEEISRERHSRSGRSSKGKSNNNNGHTVPNGASKSNAQPKPAKNR